MSEKPILFSGEQWREIPGYEGRYEVSSLGRVRSLSTYRPGEYQGVLRTYRTTRGYEAISLRWRGRRKGYSVHRLVMLAFAGPCPTGMQVAHNNGTRTDNRLENLRYATPSSNIDDRRRHGRTARGSRCGAVKLDEAAVKTIGGLRDSGLSAGEVAHLACVHTSTVQAIWRGRNWRHITGAADE